jgi:hypothetical protein
VHVKTVLKIVKNIYMMLVKKQKKRMQNFTDFEWVKKVAPVCC